MATKTATWNNGIIASSGPWSRSCCCAAGFTGNHQIDGGTSGALTPLGYVEVGTAAAATRTATTTTASINTSSFSAATPGVISVHVSCASACGKLDFREDGMEWAMVSLDSNGNFVSSGPPPIATAGPHTVVVSYLGNPTYAASTSNTVSFTILPAGATATTTTASITSTSFTAGSPGVISVNVSCNSACGSVDFKEDGVEWATVALNSAGNFVASGIPNLSVGQHTVSVNYLGNAQFAASSNSVNFTVVSAGAATTTTAESISSSSFTASSPGYITVHVSCSSACGNVDFREDGKEWATVPLNSAGNFVTSAPPDLSLGQHTLSVNYLGNAQYAASSNSVNFTVVATGAAATTTTETISSSSFSAANPGYITVHVSCSSACGNVDFREDGKEWATVPLDSGGNFVTSRPPDVSVGQHTLSVNFLGNAQYAPSANSVNFTVVAAQ